MHQPQTTTGGIKVFSLVDALTTKEAELLGFKFVSETKLPDRRVMAKRTGEFRAPKQGEWFLSGAIPEAYRAPNDLSGGYDILELVVVRKVVNYVMERK